MRRIHDQGTLALHLRFALVFTVFALMLGACHRHSQTAPTLADLAAGADVELPASSLTESATDAPIVVLLEKTRVRIAGDPDPVLLVPADAALGFSADDKPNGRSDFFVTPLAEAFAGARDAARDAGALVPPAVAGSSFLDEGVVVIADAHAPYRAFFEVAFTAAQSELSSIYLAVRAGARVTTMKLVSSRSSRRYLLAGGSTPLFSHTPNRPTPREPGPARVSIGANGIDVAFGETHVAPGCTDSGAGLTLPSHAGSRDYDFVALAACAKRLHEVAPDVSDVTLGADADVPLLALVHAVDALRGDAREKYFDEVSLTAPGARFP